MTLFLDTTIDELIARGALFVANHSGGKDSQAMLIKLLERIPAQQIIVVHASLGDVEWPGALEHAQQQAEAAGLPFIVARARFKDHSNKGLLDIVARKAAQTPEIVSWPSKAQRYCTSELKTTPIQREIRAYLKATGREFGATVVNCTGIRAQESVDRAKATAFKSVEGPAKRTWFEWLPIHDMTVDEVWATIAGAGQVAHPAYAAGSQRLSCVFCIMASRNDLKLGRAAHPELFARYTELERRTGYTMHMSRKSLEELTA